MRAVRRIYIYAVAGVTLLIAAIGAINVFEVGLDTLFHALSGESWVQGGPDWERERLSFSVPFLVIAAPIWYLHWRMAQRAVQGPDATLERRSVVRALYVTLLLLASLQMFVPSLVNLIAFSARGMFGQPMVPADREMVVTSLAAALVVGVIWAYHIVTYHADIRVETEEHRSSLLPQLYLYLAALVGAVVLLFGAADLLRLAIDAPSDENGFGDWWREPLANGLALTVTGGLVWGAHWRYAEHLLETSGWWGRSERNSGLRRVYLLAVLLVTTFMTLFTFADGVDGIVRLVLGVNVRERPDEPHLSAIAGAFAAIMPFAAFWVVHRFRLLAEPRSVGFPMLPVTAHRLLDYTMAFLGLLLGTAGIAMLLAESIQLVTSEDSWQTDIGWPIGLVIGGAALWACFWRSMRERLTDDPEAEQVSTPRRAYLFVVFGSGLVALVVGFAMTIYQVLQEVLGVAETAQLASEIALPLGVTVVAVGVALPHGLLLRRDLAPRQRIEQEEAEALTGQPQVTLTLIGPAGGELEAVVEALRRQLPEGYRLDR